MCNPRRVKVRASRRLSQAWQAAVERNVTLTDTVTGEARIVEPVGAGLAAPVRARLQRILDEDARWEETEDGLRRDLDGGYLLYRPDTGELEIVATVQVEISADGSATRNLGGMAEAEAETEVTVRYYDDGYQGQTKQAALREGEQLAGDAAEEQARERLRTVADERRAAAERALAAQAGDIDEEARAEARRSLDEQRATLTGTVETRAREQARRVHREFMEAFNEPLTHAYRDVLLERARQSDARNLYYREENGVIEIQFEVQ